MSVVYTPTILEKGLRGEFLRVAEANQPKLVDMLADRVSSNADNEKYIWLGQAPQMVELEDEIEFDPFTETSYTITNVEYAAGLTVKRRQVINDQLGGVMMRVRSMAQVAANHPDALLTTALINGTTNLGYDGVAFFADAHPARKNEGGTQDNLLAGSGSTTANIQADINTALAYFTNTKAENGEPFFPGGVTQVVFVIPASLRKAFSEALKATKVGDTDNTQIDGLDLRAHVSGRLSDTDDWYALATGGGLRPLIFQEREPLRFEALETGERAFRRSQFQYKAQAYHAAGYGSWQAACKFVN